ncbi:MAG: hypothetical protein OHK0013_03320 [Sandaracinaceae bacterium]
MEDLKNNRSTLGIVALAGLFALPAGCAEATGTLDVEVSGEEAATMGFPVGDITFADGWTVSFEHLFVALDDFHLAAGERRLALEAEPTVVDLAEGDQLLWSFAAIPAQRWPEVGYAIAPPTASARRLGRVRTEDVAALVAAGASFRMIGAATHPTHGRFEIDLALPLNVRTSGCVSGRDETDGVVIPTNGTRASQITLHLDHLFFDSARAEEPALRFEAWAAAAGADRTVTYEDLATQRLADLRGLDGMPLDDESGALIAYEPPSTGLPSQTLQAFVLGMAVTIGHFEGEGHCDYEAR